MQPTDATIPVQIQSREHNSESDVVQVEAYYNPHLDPKRYLDGPLSNNAATRLRQMLARPGIIVRPRLFPALQNIPLPLIDKTHGAGGAWHLRRY